MVVLRITEFYPDYALAVQGANPHLGTDSYTNIQANLKTDGFAWYGSWERALAKRNISCQEAVLKFPPSVNAYLKERGMSPTGDLKRDSSQMALDLVRQVEPEILWWDSHQVELLSEIRRQNPKIRLVLGWCGSARPDFRVFKGMDVVLSCAPETVEALRAAGMRSDLLHHGFDPAVQEPTLPEQKSSEICFVGNILPKSEFHLRREQILLSLCESNLPLQIYSPNALRPGLAVKLKDALKIGLYRGLSLARKSGVSNEHLRRLPVIGPAANWTSRPVVPVKPQLRKRLSQALYGRQMLGALSRSRVSLNIHADSSPRFASNMRLFEATGMNSVLLTEAYPNMSELFSADEVVTYASIEECVERARYLLDHPQKAEEIANRGRTRTLRDHTFDSRAVQFLELVRNY